MNWSQLVVLLCAAFAPCFAAAGRATAQPVSDESVRLAVLRSIFAGAQISAEKDARISRADKKRPKPGELFFPNALADEKAYRVVGKATNEAERQASENLLTGTLSDARQVRVRLFEWPNEKGAGLVAIVQYNFQDANPPACCWSIGRLAHLARNATRWEIRSEYLLGMQHHSSIQRIELLDLTGEGASRLLVESDFGGAETAGSSLQIFDLSHGRFDELVNTNASLKFEDQEGYTQVLDPGRTRRSHGQLFCFTKTILFEGGEYFNTPRTARPCYKRGDGVDSEHAEVRMSMLAPLR